MNMRNDVPAVHAEAEHVAACHKETEKGTLIVCCLFVHLCECLCTRAWGLVVCLYIYVNAYIRAHDVLCLRYVCPR
jgi:hypothetical protein